MAKKSSLVDKALEVSRKNRVPKKPVKTKGKKTVPAVLDWGTGIPEDKLAYLNDDEMALLQAHRMFKGKRSFDGIPAFPDVGDTAAGGSTGLKDGASTKGTTSSGGAGTGKGGDSGAGNSAGDSGGGRSGTGASSSNSSGSQSKDNSNTSTSPSAPSSGPDRGPTGGPARTAPSAAPSGPGGFGPRQPESPVSTAPSTQSWQGALDRIARGSTVIGNPNNQKQITDRVPQAAPSTVKYSQAPTTPVPTAYGPSVAPVEDPFQQRYAKTASYLGAVTPTAKPAYQPSDMRSLTRSASALSGPNVGLGYSPAAPGSFAQTDYSIGGNGPLSDEGVSSYDRNIQDALNAQAAANSAKAMAELASEAQKNVFGGPRTTVKAITDRAPTDPNFVDTHVYGPGSVYSSDDVGLTQSSMNNVVNGANPPSIQPVSASAAVNHDAYMAALANSRYSKPSTQLTQYDPTLGRRQSTTIPSWKQGGTYNPPAAPSQKQGPIDVPGYPPQQADISPFQGDYSPSQAPAYDVSPSQQSGWTSAQRDAYLGSLGNSKTGQIPLAQSPQQTQAGVAAPVVPPTTLAPMPDWVDYSYLYNDYPQLAMGVNPSIGAFNQYNATFRRGGRVGDSIEAALRLALQGIVSRNKTS